MKTFLNFLQEEDICESKTAAPKSDNTIALKTMIGEPTVNGTNTAPDTKSKLRPV
jgi:hypothetical protein